MDIDLPDGWREVDRTEEFAAEMGISGPVTPAHKTFEGPDGRVVVVHDELDKPDEYQHDPRFQIEVVGADGVTLEHGLAESTHERAEAAVEAAIRVLRWH